MNDNPWYLLATVHGEQPAGLMAPVDEDLATENRIAWNRWMAIALSEQQCRSLVDKGFPKRELVPLSIDDLEFRDAFIRRTNGLEVGSPPDPNMVIDFTNVQFDKIVIYRGYLFPQFVDFNSANFFGRAHFSSAMFFGGANFHGAAFSHRTVFDGATFSGHASFINTTFNAITIFNGARFETRVPDFRGATMHGATEWHEVEWPPEPRDKVSAQDQVNAYERLKAEMEQHKKHEDEQFFFRKELRARRWLLPRGSVPWFANYAYEALSDYGHSIGLPILWLWLGVLCGTAAFFLCRVFNGEPMAASLEWGLSAANIFSFLPIKREIMTTEMIAGLSAGARFISALQSLLGVVLLFLLGLALRNRFRMK